MNFDLEKFNIYPKKTYDIHFNFPFEKIPNELFINNIKIKYIDNCFNSSSIKSIPSTLFEQNTSILSEHDLETYLLKIIPDFSIFNVLEEYYTLNNLSDGWFNFDLFYIKFNLKFNFIHRISHKYAHTCHF